MDASARTRVSADAADKRKHPMRRLFGPVDIEGKPRAEGYIATKVQRVRRSVPRFFLIMCLLQHKKKKKIQKQETHEVECSDILFLPRVAGFSCIYIQVKGEILI